MSDERAGNGKDQVSPEGEAQTVDREAGMMVAQVVLYPASNKVELYFNPDVKHPVRLAVTMNKLLADFMHEEAQKAEVVQEQVDQIIRPPTGILRP